MVKKTFYKLIKNNVDSTQQNRFKKYYREENKKQNINV